MRVHSKAETKVSVLWPHRLILVRAARKCCWLQLLFSFRGMVEIYSQRNYGNLFPNFLDSRSMTLCSSRSAGKFHLQRKNVNGSVGSSPGVLIAMYSITIVVICNKNKTYSCKLEFFESLKIIHLIPSGQIRVDISKIVIPESVKLADPYFYKREELICYCMIKCF
ncbi:hypothetical protein NPIL_323371 [Nephila pilipes]|uniref:Uncharacterized protein n=1 Tax=Nephila pilipes TaxID=299642 RepID=A0A8X6JBA8_NEPPI|nr:hypothetical protein NPIL_323371 [Nephila pilipes]